MARDEVPATQVTSFVNLESCSESAFVIKIVGTAAPSTLGGLHKIQLKMF